MQKIDRLSALVGRFELTVTPKPAGTANLLIFEDETSVPTRMLFAPLRPAISRPSKAERVTFAAQADWGGTANPFLNALPAQVELQITDDPETAHIAKVLKAETDARRCGAGAVLDRLGEVLLIRILRHAIERGTTDVGLLAGLADPRLSRAIVAMHDDPGRRWSGTDLARHAGLSLSRFSELFRDKVGEPPAAYLRRWRMVLARQDAERGDRIQTIARRYGYGSPEALSRAFKRAHDQTATALRHDGR
ncbi:MAG: AraC family transcriptional regulator [Pseudomonadota bacterium]